jgi:membrane protein
VVRSVAAASERTNLPLIAGGVAFFGLMAAIPGLAAVVALVGVFGDPLWVGMQVEALGGIAPDAALIIIHEQVAHLLETRDDKLLAGAVFNMMLSLWSALQGTRWTLMALTAVNRRAEKRNFVRRYMAAGMFTLYGMGISVLAVLLIGAAPIALSLFQVAEGEALLLLVLRWPVLLGAGIGVALLLYRWGPRRRPPPWRWLWPGAVAAPLLWVIASSILTYALREFPAFGAAYGSLASVVTLLLWLYLTAYVFLLGGALSAELEFFAAGRPSQPVEEEESIQPPTTIAGEAQPPIPKPAAADPSAPN